MITLVAWKLIALLLGFMLAGMVLGMYLTWKAPVPEEDIWSDGTKTGRIQCDQPNVSNIPKPPPPRPLRSEYGDKGKHIDLRA